MPVDFYVVESAPRDPIATSYLESGCQNSGDVRSHCKNLATLRLAPSSVNLSPENPINPYAYYSVDQLYSFLSIRSLRVTLI